MTVSRAKIVGQNTKLGRRLAGGMKQEHLAKLIQKPRNRLSEWENGYHEPRAETLEAIARELGQPLVFFFADNSDIAAALDPPHPYSL